MQYIFRSVYIFFASLFFCLSLNSAYAEDTVQTNLLPIDCGGANFNDSTPISCAFGFIYDGVTGKALQGVTVELQNKNKIIITQTKINDSRDIPYFSVDLGGKIDINSGEIITITAIYSGTAATTYYQVDKGAQQIDLVLPTAKSDQPPIATIHYINYSAQDEQPPTEIRLAGAGADRDNIGSGTISYRWSSSIDGQLSTKAQFTLDLDQFSSGNHSISLEVQDNEGNWSMATTRSLSHMTYDFSEGWQAFNLAALPDGLNDISTLMDTISHQGGCPQEVANWRYTNWVSYAYGMPFGNFEIESEKPYLLRAFCDSQLTLLSQDGLRSDTTIELFDKWTFITYPFNAPSMTAEDACLQVVEQEGQMKEIAYWDASHSGWSTYECSASINNFTLHPGGNYFIQSDLESIWTPQPRASTIDISNHCMSLETESSSKFITSMPKISNIRITNLGTKQASISWITDIEADSLVRYGTDIKSLNHSIADDRCTSYRGVTHHVTINDLSPETIYYFMIESDGIIEQNDGMPYRFVTAPVQEDIQGLDATWGQVLEENSHMPIVDALVYLRVVDNNGTGNGRSAWLSGLTDVNGFWSHPAFGIFQLSDARTETGDGPFNYSHSGDLLEIQVYYDLNCTNTHQIDTKSDSPAEPIFLACDTIRPTATVMPSETPSPSIPITPIPNILFSPIKNIYCQTGLGYVNISEIENALQTGAKKLAASKKFNQLLNDDPVLSTSMTTCNAAKENLISQLTTFVQISEAEYYNGTKFAEVCISISSYITEEAQAKFSRDAIIAEACN